MDGLKRSVRTLIALGLASFSANSVAAVPIDSINVSLAPLIDSAYRDRNRFAVDIPHALTLENAGLWTVSGSTASWSYAVRIPSAVSLSFHALRAVLPPSAVLTVRSHKGTYTYRASDVHRGGIWSRVAPGDLLQFQLTLSDNERTRAVLDIASFQAGYRGLGPGMPDHPHYARLKTTKTTTSNSSCVQNYECDVTGTNTAPAQATIGLIISNQFQCSGTLLNDVPGDQVPYVLTARHCESGQLGGGNPGAAASIRVYWDATTSCGQPLGLLYDPTVKSQVGAVTVVEQQDVWLVELDQSPIVTDAYFAGFDASGGVIQGGYTIHHALSFDKQLTGWFGQAASVQMSAAMLSLKYTSNFWETVSQSGTIGPGASGSGLFDQNDHLVGSLSLGRNTGDATGYGMCPANPPAAPNGSNGSADFTSLAAVWNSTADTTSTTATTTLRSTLDPAATGQLVVAGAAEGTGVVFTSSGPDQVIGNTVLFSWSAAGATGCTASGGVSGDTWSGAGATSGTLPITEAKTGVVTYGLSCTFPGGRKSNATVVVTWLPTAPFAVFSMSSNVWTTRPAQASWTSNESPCTISGGGATLTGLPAVGSTTVTESVAGAYNFTLTCGSGTSVATAGASVAFVAPDFTFYENASDRRLGEPFSIGGIAYADSCAATGGAPNDGWANRQLVGPEVIAGAYPAVTSPGTYTYGLTCTSGPLSVSKQVTVTFENNAPYVTFTASTTNVTDVGTLTLSWQSNVDSCIGADDKPFMGGSSWAGSPQGSVTESPTVPGTYTLTITCSYPGGTVTSAPLVITVTDVPPTATLTASATTVTVNTPLTLTWSSTNAVDCSANQGGGGFPWVGSINSSGTVTASPTTAGTFTFVVTCGRNNESANAQVVVTVTPEASGGGGNGGGGGGGGHGGGAFGVGDILALAILAAIRRRRETRRVFEPRLSDPLRFGLQ
jgi:lysyl endopeptidase